MIICKQYSDLSINELYAILQLRSEVFVLEQTCLYQDIDGKDKDSYHVYIKDNNNIVAYLRILKKGTSYKDAPSIGRVLVKESARHKGYATKIMEYAINYIYHHLNEHQIIISAQEYLQDFYSSLGFIQQGEGYLEDDIPHIKMIHTT